MPQPIVFYDLDRKLSDGESEAERCWSPNTFKTRIPLNIKRIPYTVVWLHYADIKPTLSKLGIAPHLPSESPVEYTLPAIHDPNTGRSIMDSARILEYLEAAYPRAPSLFPPHTRALQAALVESVVPRLFAPAPGLLVADVIARLADVDRPFFRARREEEAGVAVEDMALEGAARAEKLEGFEAALRDVARWLDAGGGPYFTGAAPCDADAQVAGMLLFVLRMGGKGHDMVEKVAGNGRVVRYLEDMQQFVGDWQVW